MRQINLRAKKLWGGPEVEEEVMENMVPINMIEGPKILVLDDEDEVIVESGVNEEDGVGVELNVGQVPTQSTFARLSDIVLDLEIGEDINERQEEEGLSGNTNDSHGHVGLSVEELEAWEKEKAELRAREVAEQEKRDAANLREKEAAKKRAQEGLRARQQLTEPAEKRWAESKKAKSAAKTARSITQQKGKRKVNAQKYNTRDKGQKHYKVVDDEEDTDEGSDFFVDSDYDQEVGSDDDVAFEENVTEPSVVLEFEEMGYGGNCSDNADDSDELGSLSGSGTEEADEGNVLPKRDKNKVKTRPWIRSVDLRNSKFKLGSTFPNHEQLKEAVREVGIRNQLGLWFKKNTPNKVEVHCQWKCSFRLYASTRKNEGQTITIRTLIDQHTCSPVQTSHFLDYNKIAKEVQKDLLVDED
ncbi:hypothetical protein ACLB2K_035580 [Fragaria x ananassa]